MYKIILMGESLIYLAFLLCVVTLWTLSNELIDMLCGH